MIPPPAGGSAATSEGQMLGTARVDRQLILLMNANPGLRLWRSPQQVVG